MSEKNKGTPFPGCFLGVLTALPLLLWHMLADARETWRLTGKVGR